ncbi:MAG TPA: FAD-binding oxidoreductase [Gammaproteobacteria bacterium]|nr:FAD-binding oxidoreductase [Gammaproteobacteria bacterium]
MPTENSAGAEHAGLRAHDAASGAAREGFARYERKKAELAAALQQTAAQAGGGQLRLAKSTISNLFRYQGRDAPVRRLSLGHFNEVIALDASGPTMDVEGLTTYETAVTYALERGFLPLVAPELKHITVGGATVGIGIESTCFRYGFVHDGLVEADVLLPGGRIVTCTADNEYADLFRALPNSYGTLGYILRARIRLQKAQPFVHLSMRRFDDPQRYLDAMLEATEDAENDFVEGLVFAASHCVLMTGRFAASVARADDIVRRDVFYKLVERRDDVYLATRDYIFRYDPDWFWNIPESWPYALFRRYAPERFRNSGFYTRYVALKARLRERAGLKPDTTTEPLIQDWEVPWQHGEALLRFALEHVDLGGGRPWAAVPIKAPRQPTLYPIEPGVMYFNLGCYCHVARRADKEPYYYTKILDRKCFELGGIKMLYSSTFLGEQEFDARYNGAAYRELKQKYDPEGRAMTLYRKVALAPA